MFLGPLDVVDGLEVIPRYLKVYNILEPPITPPATPLMTKIRY